MQIHVQGFLQRRKKGNILRYRTNEWVDKNCFMQRHGRGLFLNWQGSFLLCVSVAWEHCGTRAAAALVDLIGVKLLSFPSGSTSTWWELFQFLFNSSCTSWTLAPPASLTFILKPESSLVTNQSNVGTVNFLLIYLPSWHLQGKLGVLL